MNKVLYKLVEAMSKDS